MGTTIFSSEIQKGGSEAMYKDWLANHRDGFVVNFLKNTKAQGSKSDARFTRIHRASCKHINPLTSEVEKAGFTTGRYQKACTLTLDDALKEGVIRTGLTSIKYCQCIHISCILPSR